MRTRSRRRRGFQRWLVILSVPTLNQATASMPKLALRPPCVYSAGVAQAVNTRKSELLCSELFCCDVVVSHACETESGAVDPTAAGSSPPLNSCTQRTTLSKLYFPNTMSSMPTIHIIDLPDDVLLRIAELLPKADLAELLRVNFEFHRIGLAVLLKLQSPVDFMTTRPSVVIQPSDPFFFINSCFFSKDYALQVHSVTVPPHGRHWCSPFKVPDMPNVDVIRLKLAERLPEEPCWRTIHSDVPPPMVFFGDCPQDNWCPLLDIPSAKTLVIVETHSFHSRPVSRVCSPLQRPVLSAPRCCS